MKITKIITVLAVVMCSQYFVLDLLAQAATIQGQLRMANDQPVINAVVAVGGKYDITDTDGRYRIKDVQTGQQKIIVQKYNDIINEENINITQDELKKDITIPTKYWVIVGSYKDKTTAQIYADKVNLNDKELHAFVGARMPGNEYYPVIVGKYLPMNEAIKLKKRALLMKEIREAYLSSNINR